MKVTFRGTTMVKECTVRRHVVTRSRDDTRSVAHSLRKLLDCV